ncbi:MAG: histone deacetylase [Solirubrobacterales bacterium]|nr:MAG: histone deacetylase [Solirubrobacterales bacterium]
MAGAPVFLSDPSSLAHDTGAHPEQAARITAIERSLEQQGWLGCVRVRSPAVSLESLAAVHSAAHIEAVRRLSARGGGQLDLDTVLSAGSFEAALHAAGGAVALAELLVAGEAPYGFSAHRPPGHHATRSRAMGFCLFDNIAVAARHAVDALGLARVMIFDWDVHHGNGTNDIFHSDDEVLFVSIHQSPLYPGTGAAGDLGAGRGEGFTVNLPVPPGAGDSEYRSLVDHVVVPLARAFEPQLVLISAGDDAHRDDPLAQCRVTEAGFAAMAASMRAVCRSLGAPIGCVLEGGYALEPLARSVAATLEALGGGAEPAASTGAATGASVGVAPVARAAQERLARWWPGLG